MELTKQDTQRAKGIAVLGMVMLHLFCRLENLPYSPWIWIGDTPLVYYLGLFGDVCVPTFCFCSGYAHYLLKEIYQTEYHQYIAEKILRFLINYWIVLVLFSAVGLLTDNGDTMPGTMSEFLGNVFLYRISYNGAWWFVVIYIFLTLLSPVLIWTVNRLPAFWVIMICGGIYLVSYLFRFDYSLEIPNATLNWAWQQLILLGTSQFSYVIGLVFRKNNVVSIIRNRVYNSDMNRRKSAGLRQLGLLVIIRLLPMLAFVGHCVVQSLFVAPCTAIAVMLSLFVGKMPKPVDCCLLALGKHSTNIWLVHMFFYLTVFEGLIFAAKYPVLILTFMMLLCLGVSWLINLVYTFTCAKILKKL